MVTTAGQQIAGQANANKNKDVFGSIIYNVKAYGAKGDGVTDDTAAIKDALDACKNAGGGIVRFLAETYIVDNLAYALTSTMVIEGSGKDVTIIKNKNNSTGTRFFSLATGCTIRDITLDGNKTNQTVSDYGILGYRISGAYLENVKVTNQYGIGIGFSGCWDCKLVRCEVWYSGNQKCGFWCDVDTNVDPYNRGGHTFIDCISMYNDLDGLICNCSFVRIFGGKYNYNGQNVGGGGALGAGGIYNDSSKDGWIVVGVTCDYNTEYGINGVFYYAVFDDVSCKNNDLSGLRVRETSHHVKIMGSEFLRNGNSTTTSNPTIWGKAGIQFDGVNNLTVMGCVAVDERAGAAQTQTFGIQNMNTAASTYVKVISNNLKFNKTDDSNIDPVGYTTTVPSGIIYELNSGARRKAQATFSGNGTTTAFVIAHGLGSTPVLVNLTPGSAAANGAFYATADATNITITYTAAPASGTNNVVLWWEAEAR